MTAPQLRGLLGVLLCIACSGLWLPGAQSRVITAEKPAGPQQHQQQHPNQVTASHRVAKVSKLPSAADEQPADNEASAAAPNPPLDSPDLQTEASRRHHKMLDFFGLSGAYYPSTANFYPPPQYQQANPYAYSSGYYEPPAYPAAYEPGVADLEDLAGRANRRKPQAGNGNGELNSAAATSSQNSPIFYIRLPPTPYMYVPGMGYISQPPTIRPMSQQFPAMLGPPAPPVVNPFIQVPVSFLANGKPTNVYEWPGSAAPQQQQPQYLGGGGGVGGIGGIGGGGGYPGLPQYPSYLPARPLQPQRPPGYRPHKPLAAATYHLPDSKITHLKGPYVFNGRPEEIFVLPNSGPPPPPPQQPPHYGGGGGHQHYQTAAQYEPSAHYQSHYPGGGGYHPAQSPYGDGYNSIYSNQMFSYY